MQEGAWLLYIFLQNHNYQGGTGKYIYKGFANRQQRTFLKHDVDRKATQVQCTIRIAFFADSYIFCTNYPAIFYYSYS